MHDTSNNDEINDIARVETESQPPILIGYIPGENKAESYLITGAWCFVKFKPNCN